MPIYEYRCKNCNKEFECLVLRSDDSVCCPDCDDVGVERLMSGFSFKSSGRYSSSASTAACHTCASKNCSTCH